jgi:hypothetical protein
VRLEPGRDQRPDLLPPFKVQLACVLSLLALGLFFAEAIREHLAAPHAVQTSAPIRCPQPAPDQLLVVTFRGREVVDCFVVASRRKS